MCQEKTASLKEVELRLKNVNIRHNRDEMKNAWTPLKDGIEDENKKDYLRICFIIVRKESSKFTVQIINLLNSLFG